MPNITIDVPKQVSVAVLIPTVPENKETYEKCLESLRFTEIGNNLVMDIFRLENDYEGFAKTVNKGIENCSDYDFIAILNDDIEVVPSWLTMMIECFKINELNGKNIGIVVDRNGYRNLVKGQEHVVFFCSLIKKEVFEKIGLLDERFFPAYVEDIDFSVRCKDGGYEFAYLDTFLCKHKVQGTFGKNPDKEKIIAENWQRFKEKYKGTKWENFKENEDKEWELRYGKS